MTLQTKKWEEFTQLIETITMSNDYVCSIGTVHFHVRYWQVNYADR